jgi:hypothetical protein
VFRTHTNKLLFLYIYTVSCKARIRRQAKKQCKLSSRQKLICTNVEGNIWEYTFLTLTWKLYYMKLVRASHSAVPCVICSRQTALGVCLLVSLAVPCKYTPPVSPVWLFRSLPVNVINLYYLWRVSFKITGSSVLEEQRKNCCVIHRTLLTIYGFIKRDVTRQRGNLV